jgi:acyl carrier protein
MTKTQLKNEIAKALDLDSVGDDFNFSQCESFDSVSVMSLIALINRHFNIILPGKKLISLTTLDSLIEMIGKDRIANE